MSHSAYLTPIDAKRAILLAVPSIQAMIDSNAVHRSDLHIVVLCPVTGIKLAEHSLGDSSQWEHPYDRFATGKANLAFKHGVDTRVIASLTPHLLEPGDVLHPGGVCLDGIPVGVSGFKPEWDEAVAYMIAGFLAAIAKAKYRESREVRNLDFAPEHMG